MTNLAQFLSNLETVDLVMPEALRDVKVMYPLLLASIELLTPIQMADAMANAKRRMGPQ